MNANRILTVFLFLIPIFCFGNGLPPFIWTNLFHIFILTIPIILIEIFVLNKISQTKPKNYWIVIGNIISLLVGIFVSISLTEKLGGNFFHGTLYSDNNFLIFPASLIIGVLVNILIELPFFYLALSKNKNFFLVLKLTILTNLTTNIPIVIYYLIAKATHFE